MEVSIIGHVININTVFTIPTTDHSQVDGLLSFLTAIQDSPNPWFYCLYFSYRILTHCFRGQDVPSKDLQVLQAKIFLRLTQYKNTITIFQIHCARFSGSNCTEKRLLQLHATFLSLSFPFFGHKLEIHVSNLKRNVPHTILISFFCIIKFFDH